MSKSSLEEYLKSNGEVTYTNMGVSMMPLLRQGKDVFTLRRKGTERCRLGDVVLFRRSSGKFVLHRVIEVHPDDYVIMEDMGYSTEAFGRGCHDSYHKEPGRLLCIFHCA